MRLNQQQIESYTLFEIETIMQKLGKSLKDIDGMPQPDPSLLRDSGNRLLYEELNYDTTQLKVLHEQSHAALNPSQKIAYDAIIQSVEKEDGDGTLYDDADKELIQMPPDICMNTDGDPMKAMVEAIYPSLLQNYNNATYLKERAILTPKNEMVHELNDMIMNMIPGDSRTYLSSDTVCKASVGTDDNELLYPAEFLHSLKFNGVPNHDIKLKEGTPEINQTTSTSTIKDQKPVFESLNFLDLNLSAPDEGNDTSVLEFSPWWIESNHQHDSFLNFFSN
ncbi:hypothetical protein POM88_046745 [Heracleum sosnowskyi]|uniref:ATP-dependent DNA helicase n=1 Tax=Heracleum sosnowskyi TaxID=360622 RepID=A0AAD8H8C8_9APIA|nr:hypothetical protein POM88_046745 [Heracleum sosnowskyi]